MFFGFLLVRNSEKSGTAIKMLTLSGAANLFLMFGMIVTVYLTEAHSFSDISHVTMNGLGIIGYICLLLGVIGKAGAIPFSSWIPDATEDAPLPFLIFFPSSLDKLMAVYLLIRVTKDFYILEPGSCLSIFTMIIGAISILIAAAMALVQSDMKKMLSYLTVCQAGYMILGIGTGLTSGILGSLSYILNCAIFTSGLYMASGAIEHVFGTTDLKKLSGLGRKMPLTSLCFIIFGLSASGVPPLGGFFSIQLLLESALKSGILFYIILHAGSFMTAASFLYIGHAVFFGQEAPSEKKAMEAPVPMLVPMSALAAICILSSAAAFQNGLRPISGMVLNGTDYDGGPHFTVSIIIYMLMLLTAVLDHIYRCKRMGGSIEAVQHIRYKSPLRIFYGYTETYASDPYNQLILLFTWFSKLAFKVERAINFIFDVLLKKAAMSIASGIHKLANGLLSRYITLALLGFVFLIIFLIAAL
jgi:formate hydrogenlyase subunit 3/multisubunit Na+/H+ antiporter MnhD subunit